MSRAYYNENDSFAASWLRELIKIGVIMQGDVDERSIADVQVEDLRGYTQCHFFAGIGVWSYALRLAGWPDGRACWTGSCPCQPFSAAGQRKGFDDARHLWPHWWRLIRERHPDTVFGEQVASALQWFDLVSGDLEGEGYAVGAAIIGAHSVGAPHIRQRLYFVGESAERRWRQGWTGKTLSGEESYSAVERPEHDDELAHSPISRRTEAREHGSGPSSLPARLAECSGTESVEYSPQQQVGIPRRAWESRSAVANSNGRNSRAEGLQRSGEHRFRAEDASTSELAHAERDERRQISSLAGGCGERGETQGVEQRPRPRRSFWSECDWLPCIDGKSRPVEPGTFPLAHGSPARVGRLRGYGNALCAPQATAFIASYMEATA